MSQIKYVRSHMVTCPICGAEFITWTGYCSAIYDKPECKKEARRRLRVERNAALEAKYQPHLSQDGDDELYPGEYRHR